MAFTTNVGRSERVSILVLPTSASRKMYAIVVLDKAILKNGCSDWVVELLFFPFRRETKEAPQCGSPRGQ